MAANAIEEAVPQAIGILGYKYGPQIAEKAGQAFNYLTTPVQNVFRPVEGRAGKLLVDVANKGGANKAPAVIDSLRNAEPTVPGERLSAGAAAVDAASPEFSGIQEIVANKAPGKYKAGGIEAQNEAARLAELGQHAGDATTLPRMARVRDEITAPMRETAEANANVANQLTPGLESRLARQRAGEVQARQAEGMYSTVAAQQDALAQGKRVALSPEQTANTPYFNVGETGGSAVAPNTARLGSMRQWNLARGREVAAGQNPAAPLPKTNNANAARVPEAQAAAADAAAIADARRAQAGLTQYQLDSLAEHGHYPLKADSVVSKLESVIRNPEMPTLTQDVMESVKKQILRRSGSDGTVSAGALYTVRKEIGNIIEQHAKESATWDKRLSSKIEGSVQRAIDDAISSAGGVGWRDYLRNYAAQSEAMGNVTSAQGIRNQLQAKPTDINAFRKSVADNEVSASNPNLLTSIDRVDRSVAREAEHQRLAGEGRQAAAEVAGLEVPKVPPLGLFSPVISTTRSLVNKFLGKLDKGTMDYLVANMDNPSKIAHIMAKATPAEREAVRAYYLKYGAPAMANIQQENQ
jgi:hypothetical protein